MRHRDDKSLRDAMQLTDNTISYTFYTVASLFFKNFLRCVTGHILGRVTYLLGDLGVFAALREFHKVRSSAESVTHLVRTMRHEGDQGLMDAWQLAEKKHVTSHLHLRYYFARFCQDASPATLPLGSYMMIPTQSGAGVHA